MAFLAIAPTGTVLPFAGTTAPEGWVLCDSGEYLKTSSAYAKLFAVVGTAFGETNGSGGVGTTHFRVPDMRGVFPRGQGTNGTANYGGVTGHTPVGGALAAKNGQKTAKNGLSNATSSLSALGLNTSSVSGSATGGGVDHTHPFGRMGNVSSSWDAWVVNDSAANRVHAIRLLVSDNTSGSTAFSHTHGLSATAAAQSLASSTVAAQTISGDTETTPASLALNYIIKL